MLRITDVLIRNLVFGAAAEDQKDITKKSSRCINFLSEKNYRLWNYISSKMVNRKHAHYKYPQCNSPNMYRSGHLKKRGMVMSGHLFAAVTERNCLKHSHLPFLK